MEQEELGRGGFGVVVAAVNRIDGRKYAIKKVRMDAAGDTSWGVLSEVSALSGLQHAHIVRYFQAWRELTDAAADGLPSASESGYSGTTTASLRHRMRASSASSDAWPSAEAAPAAPFAATARLPPLAEGSTDEGTSPPGPSFASRGGSPGLGAAEASALRESSGRDTAGVGTNDDDSADDSASPSESEATTSGKESPAQSLGGWGWDWETSAGALHAGGQRAPRQLWSTSDTLTAATAEQRDATATARPSKPGQVRTTHRCTRSDTVPQSLLPAAAPSWPNTHIDVDRVALQRRASARTSRRDAE